MTKTEDKKIKKITKTKLTEKITTKQTDVEKVVSKKASAKKVGTNKTPSKSASTKKSSTKKTKSKKASTSAKKVATNIMEYYDLPAGYNQTTVKLLFQTPKKLFVYWEISEADKKKLFEDNGKDFFEKTSPFLVVKNKTKNYSFEVGINDFANSWYFDIPDSNCEYEVVLIRKHKITQSPTLITTSNEMEVPNNQILFEQDRKEIFFKNVKTDDVVSKSVVNLQFINHLGNVCHANSFYEKFYQEEDLLQISNPTSN